MTETTTIKKEQRNYPLREKLFVYGTLQNGFRNNRILQDNYSRFLSKGLTVNTFCMADAGSFPVVLQDGLSSYPVAGEVWAVDNWTLERTDRLEACGRMYLRMKQYIRLSASVTIPAWMYIGEPHYWGRFDLDSDPAFCNWESGQNVWRWVDKSNWE